jgi:hypothetical protein
MDEHGHVEDLTDRLDLVEAKILFLEPGDIIALRYPGLLTPKQAESLKADGEAAFPGHVVAVLSQGIDVVIVREPEPM